MLCMLTYHIRHCQKSKPNKNKNKKKIKTNKNYYHVQKHYELQISISQLDSVNMITYSLAHNHIEQTMTILY